MAHRQKPLPTAQGRSGWQDWALRIWLRFQRFATDIGGVAIVAISLMTLLALLGMTGGALLSPFADFLKRWLGSGSYLVVLIAGWLGILLIVQRFGRIESIPWSRVLALEVAAFSFITILTLFGGVELARAEAGLDGGLVGWGLADLTGLALGGIGRALLVTVVFVWSALYGLDLAGPLVRWLGQRLEPAPAPLQESGPVETQNPAASNGSRSLATPGVKLEGKAAKRSLPSQFRKKLPVISETQPEGPPPPRDPELPPLDLLQQGRMPRPNERNINLTAGMIEKTLSEFGVPAKVVGVQVGPTVTQFAVEPGFVEKPGPEGERQMKVRVAQISGLRRDLALALSAERLRIEAPVPGKAYVGIEVPNLESVVVRLRPVIESPQFHKIKSPLGIALGLDVSGRPVVADLANMPHLLIAGTTGSGKSVCISALTTCLAINNSPETLRLVMIDPKKVELVRFNGLPHLFGQVETDLERILGVLRWVVAEMDQRYKLLEEHRSRNIDSFNNKMRRRKNPPVHPLPRIVVMIDELADLMMIAPDQTESALVRLAQLARATGIHLVVATQRPSTDVVTGLIKANFPARLAFAVASGIDSRVILDTPGAESLLGDGDMLFLQPDAAGPIRAQGVFVTDPELAAVVKYWQAQVDLEDQAPWDEMLEEEAMLADRDELVERAIAIIQETGRASASMLQRRLKIGYPRAARLIDELEELGVVGPSMGGGRERDVLVDPEEDD